VGFLQTKKSAAHTPVCVLSIFNYSISVFITPHFFDGFWGFCGSQESWILSVALVSEAHQGYQILRNGDFYLPLVRFAYQGYLLLAPVGWAECFLRSPTQRSFETSEKMIIACWVLRKALNPPYVLLQMPMNIWWGMRGEVSPLITYG
jgi:hypothetical protein